MYIHPEKDEEISNPTVLFSSRMLEGFSENQMRAKPLGKLHFAVEAERAKKLYEDDRRSQKGLLHKNL